jgi:ABC-type Fe3+/spermidine/putrescine transport system ATPase subunit
VIEVRGLHARAGSFHLRDIDLELPRGGSLAVLGPSGAGKSLLLETILGLRPLQRGEIRLEGRRIDRFAPELRGIAYIPQDLGLFPHLSVVENLLFAARVQGRLAEGRARLPALAQALGLVPLLERRSIQDLSGGESQRVALGRALLLEPKVLALDEPFAALDGATAGALRRKLRELRRELGLTLLLVTHDLEEAAMLADDLALLEGGALVERGPASRTLARPRTLRGARLIGRFNILPREALLDLGSGLCPDASATHAAFLPASVRVADPAGGGSGPRARLVEWIPTPGGARAGIELRGGLRVDADVPLPEVERLTGRLGRPVAVAVDPAGVFPLREP